MLYPEDVKEGDEFIFTTGQGLLISGMCGFLGNIWSERIRVLSNVDGMITFRCLSSTDDFACEQEKFLSWMNGHWDWEEEDA